MLGKFRQDDDFNDYFIPESIVEEFDTMTAELGSMDLFSDEWEDKYSKLLKKYKPYFLPHPVEYYLCDINFDNQK